VPSTKAPAPPPPPGFELVWADEFNVDGPPDPKNWLFERGFVRNHEAQFYQPDNARVKDGVLVIEARRESVPNPRHEPGSADWKTKPAKSTYTSASILTRGLRQWTYGRFEMRGRIDVRKGLWPAWWTLGVAREWPHNGEAKLGGEKWAKEFHVWRMDWTRDTVRLYVDNRLLNEVKVAEAKNPDGFLPFRQPHYMILNLALGGDNGGPVDDAVFPARFEVDWVRVYQPRAK